MANIFFVIPGFNHNRHTNVEVTADSTLLSAWSSLCGSDDQGTSTSFYSKPDAYVINNGKLASWIAPIADGQTYHVVPRLPGGKGGFGSMLRALGAQIEKTTNREACRDISGRRMRDVNNEQKLREWVAKASDREHERDLKKQERRERRRAEPKHVFDDPEYTKQTVQVKEGLEEALQKGLQKVSKKTATETTSSLTKRKGSQQSGPSSSKMMALDWVGVDLDSDMDSDDSDSTSDDSGEVLESGSSDSPQPGCSHQKADQGDPQPSCSSQVESSEVSSTTTSSDASTESSENPNSCEKHGSSSGDDVGSSDDSSVSSTGTDAEQRLNSEHQADPDPDTTAHDNLDSGVSSTDVDPNNETVTDSRAMTIKQN